MQYHSARWPRFFIGALLGFCLIPTQGRADFTTVAGSDGDGPLSATVKFVAVSGGIEITVTNNEMGTLGKGQAVSALSFSFTTASGLSPSAFTELTGKEVDSSQFTPGGPFPGSATVTPLDDKSSSGVIDHWGFTHTGLSVKLATAGGSSGANPHYMILPSSGTTGSGKSLSDGHFDPYLLGPANFFLSVSGPLPKAGTDLSPDIANVSVGFGTGPDKTLPALDAPAAPAPPSAILLGIGGLTLGVARLFRRLRLATP
jgi:hypothetical protein